MRDPVAYLGPRLKEIRLKTGLSLREVARQLEVSPSFVSQIENGKLTDKNYENYISRFILCLFTVNILITPRCHCVF